MWEKKIVKEAIGYVEPYQNELLKTNYRISGLVLYGLAKELAIISIDETIKCLNELSIKNCEVDGALAINKINHLKKVQKQIIQL